MRICAVGATRTFGIRHNKTKETMNFSVGNGTLIIRGGTMQHFWKHEIPKSTENLGERINLTFQQIMDRHFRIVTRCLPSGGHHRPLIHVRWHFPESPRRMHPDTPSLAHIRRNQL